MSDRTQGNEPTAPTDGVQPNAAGPGRGRCSWDLVRAIAAVVSAAAAIGRLIWVVARS